jgi:hypothetical protein
MQEKIKFIAFGAGQCSSVLPFILDDYDLIIFADTGWELPLTYEWVKIVEKSFPEKFIWIKTNMPNTIKHHPPICTKKFKVEPIRRYLRSIKVKKAIKYLGMTYEEKDRITENSVKWVKHEYPLIDLKITRKDCQKYLLDNFGVVPPRSGCTICKYTKQLHLLNGIKLENKSICNYIIN